MGAGWSKVSDPLPRTALTLLAMLTVFSSDALTIAMACFIERAGADAPDAKSSVLTLLTQKRRNRSAAVAPSVSG
jgi:hypothetical protein